jgi:hypothetical protein
VYFGSTLFWQIAAIQGLRSSGGVGVWSDAVLPLAEYLEQKYPSREVQILDWGLQNNLYVITDARLRTREIFWGATPRQSWEGTVRRGGVFVLNGPGNRQFPAATEGFLRTLAEVHPVARTIRIQQNDGATYAEIIEIEPTAKSP